MDLIYVIPKKKELNYRKKLVEDGKTMEYNNGIVPFPKEKWDSWYNKWIGNNDKNYYYAYIYDKDTQTYVGEVAYRKESYENSVMLSIIIESKYRRRGYGKEGLKGLVTTAFENGWNEVRDLIAKNNVGSQKLFSDFGFKIVDIDKDGNVEFGLSKEEFINLYGNI